MISLLQLVSLDGIHSGVPTRTTSTLTPTTLRNIEQVSVFVAETTIFLIFYLYHCWANTIFGPKH